MKKVPVVLAILVAAVVSVSVATAGAPELERFDIDVTSPDPFLTAECGVAVTTRERGHVIVRVWDREKGTVELRTLNIALTAMAGDNVYRFRDVGADHVTLTKDGPVLSIIGQIPFGFIGILKIDLTTGDVIHEPGHDISGRLDDACEALTA
jgi:hypothetical protein